jgi:predicted dehydrogenase
LSDKQHWVRKLPGKLLHNIISHGIARIAEFLSSADPQVIAHGFSSPVLKAIGEAEIIDELRVTIVEKGGATAYFTFSSQIKPTLHEFRLYGPKNSLVLDQNHESVLRLRGAKFKSYADTFIPPVQFAGQHLENLLENMKLFVRRDLQMDSGMKFLIESFYQCITRGSPAPIPYREILLTAKIMDAIFEQVRVVRPHDPSSFESGSMALGRSMHESPAAD